MAMGIKKFSQDARYRVARIAAHGGWWGAFLALVINISLGGTRPVGDAPPWLGLIVIVLIGIAIAAGQTLGRMRITAAITRAFDVGYSISESESAAGARKRQDEILEQLTRAETERIELIRALQKEITKHDEPAR